MATSRATPSAAHITAEEHCHGKEHQQDLGGEELRFDGVLKGERHEAAAGQVDQAIVR